MGKNIDDKVRRIMGQIKVTDPYKHCSKISASYGRLIFSKHLESIQDKILSHFRKSRGMTHIHDNIYHYFDCTISLRVSGYVHIDIYNRNKEKREEAIEKIKKRFK